MLLLALAALGCTPAGERVELAPGLRLERPAPAETHTFRFDLPANQYLHLQVEQHGVDVVAALVGPGGEVLTEVDSLTGRAHAEVVRAVTRRAGEHRLEVRAGGADPDARFALAVAELRPATGTDRLRSAALAAFYRGEMLRFQDEGDSLPAAPGHYRRALTLRRRLAAGDPEPVEIQRRLGEVLFVLGRLEESQRAFRAALAGLSVEDHPETAALLHNQLGRGWRRLGEPQRAAAAYRQALRIARARGDLPGEAAAVGNLGTLFAAAGEIEAALHHDRLAVALWRRAGRVDQEVTALATLAGLYTQIGRSDEASDLLQRALVLSRQGSSDRDRFSLLSTHGWNELMAGRPDEALLPLDEALGLARKLGDPLLEAAALDRRASVLRALGRGSEARAGYTAALQRVRRAGARLGEAHTRLNLGHMALDEGRLDEAADHFDRAATLLAAGQDTHGVLAARVALAEVDRRRGDLEAAQRRLEEAVAQVETLRAELVGDLARSLFLATRFDAYERLVTVLMERHGRAPRAGFDRRALEVAESAKARSFLESLAAAGDPATLGQRRRLQARVRARETERLKLLDGDPEHPRAARLEREIRWLLLEAERLRGARVAGAEEEARPATAEEMQALLDADTVLLAYALGEERSFLWRVEGGGVTAFELRPAETVDRLARRAARLLSAGAGSLARGQTELTLAALREAVLPEPALRGLAGRRLAVVAADALHLVPFGILPDGAGRPLLADHEIVHLPSASVLALQRRRLAGRAAAPRELAVLADPVFTADDERLAGAEPTAAPSTGPPADLRRAAEDLDLDFDRLVHSAREAEEILALMPPAERFRALGFDATRELAISGVLGRYRTVHLATHGLLHPTRPELSGLVLSLLDEEGRPLDGFLRAQEVADLDLPADLVVLSACRTGLGRDIRGEGLVGLPQAFFLAGARALAVSLWPVDDAATADLMTRFHHHRLGGGLSSAAALRQAQLDLAADPARAAPFYWGGFVLMGDWR